MSGVSEKVSIPCEYCFQPILAEKVKKHGFICNVKKLQKETESLPFYKHDTNILPSTESITSIEGIVIDEDKLREKILSAYDKYIGEIRLVTNIHQECNALFEVPTKIDGKETSAMNEEENKSYFFSSMRHREQEASIVYHMEANNILNNIDTFVELGAGKAKLSHAISLVKPDAQYLCVERSSYKTKAENGLRKHYRARVDLRHVDLFTLLNFYDKNNPNEPYLPQNGKYMKAHRNSNHVKNNNNSNSGHVSGVKRHADSLEVTEIPQGEELTDRTNPSYRTNIPAVDEVNVSGDESYLQHRSVCVGKHLCGAATDFAIVAMKQLSDDINSNKSADINNCNTNNNNTTSNSSDFIRSTPRLCGFAIATCCHGSCDYNYCTAQDFLLQCGIMPQEFETFRKWAGFFAVDKTQLDREEQYRQELKTENETLSAEEVEKMVKERYDFIGRAKVGRCCKRLIDFGRLQYIKKHTNLKVDMIHYVDATTSPENCLIIGYL